MALCRGLFVPHIKSSDIIMLIELLESCLEICAAKIPQIYPQSFLAENIWGMFE